MRSITSVLPVLGSIHPVPPHGPQGGPHATDRDIATVVGVQVFCFLLLSHLEPDFFLIHFYQTTIYLGLLILLFDMGDRWAYMISAC
jgi:hypothetical protein